MDTIVVRNRGAADNPKLEKRRSTKLSQPAADTAKRKRVYISCITLARAQVRLTLSPHLCTITETTTKLYYASMVNERLRKFSGVSRFAGPSRPSVLHLLSSATASLSGMLNQSQAKVSKGKGKGKKRNR